MPGGRPTKYKPEFCERVIELGKQGASKVEIAAELGVHYHAFLNWQDKYPEFAQSVSEASRLCQAWWERKGREATFGGCEGFNATAFIFNMKNRFPDSWRDRKEQEISGPGGAPIQLEISDASQARRIAEAFINSGATSGDDDSESP